MKVGDTVEWDMQTSGGGVDRGAVHRIVPDGPYAGRVYVRNQRIGTRGRSKGKVYNCSFYWDAHEVDKLRVVEP